MVTVIQNTVGEVLDTAGITVENVRIIYRTKGGVINLKIINRRVFYQTRQSPKGEYVLYTYEVLDAQGNKENIDSLQEYERGDRVETWFDAQYNKPKMRPYKSKRNKED